MKDKEIDDILAGAAAHKVDPALLDRISSSIGASLRPVRPMPPSWKLATALLLIAAAIAVLTASLLGLDGIRKMNGTEIGTIFPALAIFLWLAAILSVAEMTPGGFRFSPARLLLIVLAGWLALDAMLFRDHQMGAFVAEGIPCLRAGVIVAIPAGVGAWLVLRRGFAVDAASAGLSAGTLAGLAGLTMLEFHCPIFQAPHIMVWHTAVIPVCAFAGALLTRRFHASARHRAVLD